MATTTPFDDVNIGPDPRTRHHQRTKSSVLRSLIGHRRNNTEATNLPSSFATNFSQPQPPVLSVNTNVDPVYRAQGSDMGVSAILRQWENRDRDNANSTTARSPTKLESPTKNSGFSLGLTKTKTRSDAPPSSPTKPKKSKSATNLAGLLSRPKSAKNLKKLAKEEEASRTEKDKENRAPPSPTPAVNELMLPPPPPIFAQFTSQKEQQDYFGSGRGGAHTGVVQAGPQDGSMRKPRPMSYQPPFVGLRQEEIKARASESRERPLRAATDTFLGVGGEKRKGSTWGRGTSARPGLLGVFPGMGGRTKSATAVVQATSSTASTGTAGSNASKQSNQSSIPEMPAIDPKDIDKHLEAMLDRRNIPENQRYKMRNLNSTIKMEFIRQDWAETAQAGKQSQDIKRPGAEDSDTSMTAADGEAQDDEKKKKHSRGRSLHTLSRAMGRDKSREKSKSRPPPGPSKKKSEGTLGRHFRSKSSENVSGDSRPSSSSGASGILAKIKGHVAGGPLDYVAYLRKVQKPELVEVGKLHKLRLLLRNETVAWAEEFIREGGMKEIVDLLHRIMNVEWREEHEDALLHENLLCLKALCTTALALQYLHTIHATLFPALLHMIFDPEKKGPSEFTTRNIITSVLLTYIETGAPGPDRAARARTILGYLRDPDAPEEQQPVSFVLEMRRERPYRVWCKEIVSVTKEVFWIFLHNLNVVALERPTPVIDASYTEGGEQAFDTTYMLTHFPRPRAPVPAAPYVGGVEWDATNYLASHLDLLNACIACLPTPADRNLLRSQLQISGFERCLGGSLRLCKEKFYGAVHEGLRTWVAAASEDGWDVRDVRYGPPPETRGKSRSVSPVKRKNKVEEPAPRLDMPKLDFGLEGLRTGERGLGTPGGGVRRDEDGWLS